MQHMEDVPRRERRRGPMICASCRACRGLLSFEPNTLERLPTIKTDKKMCALAYIPKNESHQSLLASGEYTFGIANVRILDQFSQKKSPAEDEFVKTRVMSSDHHTFPVEMLQYVPSADCVVSGSFGGGEMPVHSLRKKRRKHAVQLLKRPAGSSKKEGWEAGVPFASVLCGHPRTGSMFVVGGSMPGHLRLYDLADEAKGECMGLFKGHEGTVFGVGYSDERKLLYSSCTRETLRVWSLRERECLQVLPLGDRSHSLIFDEDAGLILCGVSGRVRVFDPRNLRSEVNSLDVSSDEERVRSIVRIGVKGGDPLYASVSVEDLAVRSWTSAGKKVATAETGDFGGPHYRLCYAGEPSWTNDTQSLVDTLERLQYLQADVRCTAVLLGMSGVRVDCWTSLLVSS